MQPVHLNVPLLPPSYGPGATLAPIGMDPQAIKPPSTVYPMRTMIRIDHIEKYYFDAQVIDFQNKLTVFHFIPVQRHLSPVQNPVDGKSTVPDAGFVLSCGDALSAAPVSEDRRNPAANQDYTVLADLERAVMPAMQRMALRKEWSGEFLPVQTETPGTHCFTSVTSQDCPGSEPNQRKAFNLIAMEPWLLSLQNMDCLITRGAFRRSPTQALKYFDSSPWEHLDSVWALIYDRCYQTRTRWWVLTNYESWIFGVFSEGWTNVVVSPRMAYLCTGPSVLQCVFLWTESAHHEDNPNYGYKPPKVRVRGESIIPRPLAFNPRAVNLHRPKATGKVTTTGRTKPLIRVQNSCKEWLGVENRPVIRSLATSYDTGLFRERDANPDEPPITPFTYESMIQKFHHIHKWRDGCKQETRSP